VAAACGPAAGSRPDGVRSRLVVQQAHDARSPENNFFSPFRSSGMGHETCTLSANRAEIGPLSGIEVQYGPCRYHGLRLGRRGGGSRDLFLSRSPINTGFLVPVTSRDFTADFTALVSHHLGHTKFSVSQPDGGGVSTGWALAERGRNELADKLADKKSLHSPSIGRVRRIRCALLDNSWATSGQLLGIGLGRKRREGTAASNSIPSRLLPGSAAASAARQQSSDAAIAPTPADKPHGGAPAAVDRQLRHGFPETMLQVLRSGFGVRQDSSAISVEGRKRPSRTGSPDYTAPVLWSVSGYTTEHGNGGDGGVG
jgi:hypothetical protein